MDLLNMTNKAQIHEFYKQSVYFQPRLEITTWLLPTPISLMFLMLNSYETRQAEQCKHTLYGTYTACHLFRLSD